MPKPSAPSVQETDAQKLRRAQKALRDKHKALQGLSDNVLLFLHQLDKVMRSPESKNRGAEVAKLCNALDLTNDQVRFGSLGVDFRADDKALVVARLLKPGA